MVHVSRPHCVSWNTYGKPYHQKFWNIDIAASLYGLLVSREAEFCVRDINADQEVVDAYEAGQVPA